LEVKVLSRDIEKALRTLKKKLQLDGVFGELKKRRFYEKPSVKKKRKQLEAQKRKRKLLKRARPSGSWPRPGSGDAVHPLHRTIKPEKEGMK
jgi:small subunit ribosomal protein S21